MIRAAMKIDPDNPMLRELLSRLLATRARHNPVVNQPALSPTQGASH
jgi:hypothetical protein